MSVAKTVFRIGDKVEWTYEQQPLMADPRLGVGPFVVIARVYDGAHWWYSLQRPDGSICETHAGGTPFQIRDDLLRFAA